MQITAAFLFTSINHWGFQRGGYLVGYEDGCRLCQQLRAKGGKKVGQFLDRFERESAHWSVRNLLLDFHFLSVSADPN